MNDYLETGAFVVMPSHVHGIIYILDGRGTVSVPKENVEIKIPEIPAPKDDGGNSITQDNKIFDVILGGETPPLQTFNRTPIVG